MPVLALAYKVAVTTAYFFFVGFLGSWQIGASLPPTDSEGGVLRRNISRAFWDS